MVAAGEARRERLAAARLYLVLEPEPEGVDAGELLRAALAGGVDVVQLRDKRAPDEAVPRLAPLFRRLCDEHAALLIVNDRPDLAAACGADGVHVGQEDVAVAEARRIVGNGLLVGASTHSTEQVDTAAAGDVDYLGVGPVFATPTKPGRAPVGLELVRHAAATVRKPWFAIGGIDPLNASDVAAAGARRIAVVRAIRDAPDPRRAATALRTALDREEAGIGTAR